MQQLSQKIQSSFSKIVDLTDVFGQLPSLRVLKKSNQKSSVGFFLTIILMTITISYLITEIVSMLQRTQPSMFASEELIFDTSTFQLKNNNFTLAIAVVDKYMNSFDGLGKYYAMLMQQCTRSRIEDINTGNITINLNCAEIPYEVCNTTHFQTELQQKYFAKSKQGSLLCINSKFQQETPPVLKGQQSSLEYTFLVIHLEKCKNSTAWQYCASEEEISNKLQSASYNIFSSDYLLQLARSDDPLEQIITPNYVSFSSTTSKKIIQYYQIVQTTTDDGLLFQNTKVQSNLKKGLMEPYSELSNGEYLIQHCVSIQSVQVHYFRSYIKIQTILAKIFVLIFSFLFKWMLNDLMLLKVSNKLFNFTKLKNP